MPAFGAPAGDGQAGPAGPLRSTRRTWTLVGPWHRLRVAGIRPVRADDPAGGSWRRLPLRWEGRRGDRVGGQYMENAGGEGNVRPVCQNLPASSCRLPARRRRPRRAAARPPRPSRTVCAAGPGGCGGCCAAAPSSCRWPSSCWRSAAAGVWAVQRVRAVEAAVAEAQSHSAAFQAAVTERRRRDGAQRVARAAERDRAGPRPDLGNRLGAGRPRPLRRRARCRRPETCLPSPTRRATRSCRRCRARCSGSARRPSTTASPGSTWRTLAGARDDVERAQAALGPVARPTRRRAGERVDRPDRRRARHPGRGPGRRRADA